MLRQRGQRVKYTLNPWVVRWEQSLQKALLTDKERKDYFIRFNVDGLLRGDYKSRMEGYAVGRQNGWLSANDIRSLEDMNPIEAEEGGDLYFAVLFQSDKRNGKKRFTKFYKVQFTEPSESGNSKQESIQFDTPTLTAKAIYRLSDGLSYAKADEEAAGFAAETGSKWYEQV